MLRKIAILLAAVLLGTTIPALAVKLDFSTGMFNLSASSANRSGNISNFGVYSIAYKHPLLRQLELNVGYTLLISGGISGDLGYGFDVGLDYFPLTYHSAQSYESGHHKMVMVESWRPYVGLSFHQRQFQAVQIGYAGFGVQGGVEHSLTESLALTGRARYLFFRGTASASASELDFLLGLSFQF